MSKIYYKKEQIKKRFVTKNVVIKLIGVALFLTGSVIVLYIFTPLVLWQIFVSPALAAQRLASPIPQSSFVNPATIQSLLASQTTALSGIDFYNAKNWFPNYTGSGPAAKIGTYRLSIPRLNITNAIVSTTDTDLAAHLVNYPGTATPPDKGNTVIIGHSTLPSLYNPKDYKTIFAYAHTLQIGDSILATVGNITYTYKIYGITIVDPTNTSVFEQNMDDSYLTIITCTPPGTIWKRLIISARLQNI